MMLEQWQPHVSLVSPSTLDSFCLPSLRYPLRFNYRFHFLWRVTFFQFAMKNIFIGFVFYMGLKIRILNPKR